MSRARRLHLVPPPLTAAARLLAHMASLSGAPIPSRRISLLFPPGDPAWAETRKVYFTRLDHHDDVESAAVFGYEMLVLTGPNAGLLLIQDNVIFLREDQDADVTAYLKRLKDIARGDTP